jgi:hypothetical protein
MSDVVVRSNLGMMQMMNRPPMISSHRGRCGCQGGNLIQVIGPPLHHPSPLGHVLGMVVRRPHRVALAVGTRDHISFN